MQYPLLLLLMHQFSLIFLFHYNIICYKSLSFFLLLCAFNQLVPLKLVTISISHQSFKHQPLSSIYKWTQQEETVNSIIFHLQVQFHILFAFQGKTYLINIYYNINHIQMLIKPKLLAPLRFMILGGNCVINRQSNIKKQQKQSQPITPKFPYDFDGKLQISQQAQFQKRNKFFTDIFGLTPEEYFVPFYAKYLQSIEKSDWNSISTFTDEMLIKAMIQAKQTQNFKLELVNRDAQVKVFLDQSELIFNFDSGFTQDPKFELVKCYPQLCQKNVLKILRNPSVHPDFISLLNVGVYFQSKMKLVLVNPIIESELQQKIDKEQIHLFKFEFHNENASFLQIFLGRKLKRLRYMLDESKYKKQVLRLKIGANKTNLNGWILKDIDNHYYNCYSVYVQDDSLI